MQTALSAAVDQLGVVPCLAIMVFGFLLGAWGQAARFPLATALGMAFIMLAIVLFMFFVLGNNPGKSLPGFFG